MDMESRLLYRTTFFEPSQSMEDNLLVLKNRPRSDASSLAQEPTTWSVLGLLSKNLCSRHNGTKHADVPIRLRNQ